MARLFLICMFHLFTSINAQDQAYLITAPKLLRLDASEKVVVQLFGYYQETKVELNFRKPLAPKDKPYASQILKLNAQNNYQDAATLRILPRDFPKEEKFVLLQAISPGSFSVEEKIPVTTVNGFLFIQTDKPLYTPEQEVKVRVYSISEELRKSSRPVTLKFVDPDGINAEIIELNDISGAKPLLPPFKLPLKPTLGIWKIVATYADTFKTTATAEFLVKEYVLPSISLQIEPEKDYISNMNFESFKLKISAKYVHGMPVNNANVFLRFGYSSPTTTVIIPSTFRMYKMQNGNLEVTLKIKDALSAVPDGPKTLSEMSEDTFLRVVVLLQESTGGITQDAVLSNVKFADAPFTLSLIATPPFIKPGLPYNVRVLVKNPLGEPEKGVSVTVKATVTTVNKEVEDYKFSGHQNSMTLKSQGDGVVYFTFNIPDLVEKIEFAFETADQRHTALNPAQLQLNAEAYVSVNHRYLYIDLPSDSSQFEVGDYMNIKIHFHYRHYLSLKTFSYQILSRGKVIKYDTVNRVSDKAQALSIKITPDMVPSARLLVYYILSGEERAELVADSVWIDIKAKCVNNLNVGLSNINKIYNPKEELQLTVSTKDESLVALSAIDTAVYGIISDEKDPMKMVLRHVEKSDLGCGSGGGKNNGDVFDRVGLKFMTNANAKSTSTALVCSAKMRPKRSYILNDEYDKKAEKYMQYKEWCLAGLHSSPTLETCKDRARRLNTQDKIAKRSFYECCEHGIMLRSNNVDTISLSRADSEFLLDVEMFYERSYFPESWLWEERAISKSGSVSITKNLPDSLTTWELKAVGVFSEGICVSNPAMVRVSKDISVNVPLPYSMVRGEQIELKGSVYNQGSRSTEFSVTLTAPEGVCVFRGIYQDRYGRPHENKGQVDGHSVALVKFYIMALEVGTHTLTFTLKSGAGFDRVIKKLRVVPEGIQTKEDVGKLIDPRGVYGYPIRKVEIKNFIPPNIVPKSKVERVLIINGEILGELLSIVNNPEGLKQLTNLPRGSAELELVALLPVYYVYQYLEKTERWGILGQEATASNLEIKRKMNSGITNIMSFKSKREYSFSMWKDQTGSTWVTALILKTFADMHKHVSLDPVVITNTIYWLINNCQNPDGSFSEKSNIRPFKLMGAGADVAEQTVFLTSYVMIGISQALTVPNHNLQVFQDAVNLAVQYLSSQVKNIKTFYARAIASYALILADINSMPGNQLYENLKKDAQEKGVSAIVRFWEEAKSSKEPLQPSKTTGKTVETTVYILLTTLLKSDLSYAKPILNWLTQDQRYGGFHSTQDTILTLEALTKYSITAQKSVLDMYLDIEYKTKGDISHIKLTQQMPMAKPIELTQNDNVIIKTGASTGVSFATLRTVYYETSQNNEKCRFDTTIEIFDADENSNDPMLLSQRIVACARYKPHENEIQRESGITVMIINLPTGVSPVQEDLNMYQNGLESRISNYEITNDQVILQIDSIPSDELYCVGFRIHEDFVTGMNSASVFRVFEYYDQENQCTKTYFQERRRLLRLCEGDQCKCMAAECCNFKSTVDPGVTDGQLKRDMCKESVKYAFRVIIESTETAGDFQTYKAKVKAVLKKGEEDIKTDSEIEFVKKATCTSTKLEVLKQYLIKGAQSIQIQVGDAYKYKFPMDSNVWVDWWPNDCRDNACRKYTKVLETFEEDIVLDGCH